MNFESMLQAAPEEKFRIVLDQGGYQHVEEATEEAVRDMFGDYVAAGFWPDVFLDELEFYSTDEICAWFMKDKRICDRRRSAG